MSSTRLLTAAEAADYMRISLATLYRMERQGKLVPFRTLGGHRRYTVRMLHDCLEESRVRRSSSPPAHAPTTSRQS